MFGESRPAPPSHCRPDGSQRPGGSEGRVTISQLVDPPKEGNKAADVDEAEADAVGEDEEVVGVEDVALEEAAEP
jgi:hypothetical protein